MKNIMKKALIILAIIGIANNIEIDCAGRGNLQPIQQQNIQSRPRQRTTQRPTHQQKRHPRRPIPAPQKIKLEEKKDELKGKKIEQDLKIATENTQAIISDPTKSPEEKNNAVQDLAKKEQEATGYISSIKNYFGYGPEAEKRKNIAQKRLEINKTKLEAEKMRYTSLLENIQTIDSENQPQEIENLAKQLTLSKQLLQQLSKEIETDEIALGIRWSGTKKLVYGSTAAATALLADWYFGMGYAQNIIDYGLQTKEALLSPETSWLGAAGILGGAGFSLKMALDKLKFGMTLADAAKNGLIALVAPDGRKYAADENGVPQALIVDEQPSQQPAAPYKTQ